MRRNVKIWNWLTLMLFVGVTADTYNFCVDKVSGLYADPQDCTSFYSCVFMRTYHQQCPPNLRFNPAFTGCDWPFNVECPDQRLEPQEGAHSGGDFPSAQNNEAAVTASTTTSKPTNKTISIVTRARVISAQQITRQETAATRRKTEPSSTDASEPTTTRELTTLQTTTATTTNAPTSTQVAAAEQSELDKADEQTTSDTQSAGDEPTPTPIPPSTIFCLGKEDGLYADPIYCNTFYRCYMGNTFHFTCPPDLFFNDEFQWCDWEYNVQCSGLRLAPPAKLNDVFQDAQTRAPQLAVTTMPGSVEGCDRVVCYYPNWAINRNGAGARFAPSDVQPELCTHIIYAFAEIKDGQLVASDLADEPLEDDIGNFLRMTNLKQTKPNLKVLLAVGGWNQGSASFSEVASTEENRQKFINTTIQFLRERNFDGLDFDWEYPVAQGSNVERERYATLCEGLRAAFEREASSGTERLLLTGAVSAGKAIIDRAYDVPRISAAFDFINVMSYDLHGSWEIKTGHHSPLRAGSWEQSWEEQLNMEWILNYWHSLGAPKNKIVAGLPLYARTFTLRSTSETGVRAPASGTGQAGPFTKETGILSYYEVCLLMDSGTEHFIESQRVPYLVVANQWVGYDNPRSLKEKVRFVRDNGYGGVMVWDLSHDDFSGLFCGQGSHPLMNAINGECALK